MFNRVVNAPVPPSLFSKLLFYSSDGQRYDHILKKHASQIHQRLPKFVSHYRHTFYDSNSCNCCSIGKYYNSFNSRVFYQFDVSNSLLMLAFTYSPNAVAFKEITVNVFTGNSSPSEVIKNDLLVFVKQPFLVPAGVLGLK